ncbi:MAG: hypothetical protein ACODAJ_08580, partial [Planctomycetota bacterium]
MDAACARASWAGWLLLIPATLAAGAAAGDAIPRRWLPVDDAGWSILAPSPDSRLIYVSSSRGSDATGQAYAPSQDAIGDDPFLPKGPVKPFKTLATAREQSRDGHPDWLLLRRGDMWREALYAPANGRSAREPAVIAAYGDGPARPQLRPRGKRSGLSFDIHRGFHDIAVVGVEFYASHKDPQSDDFDPTSRMRAGVRFFLSSKPTAFGRRLLVEDCCLRFCGATFMVARDARGGPTERLTGLVFRRNLVLDNYSRISHSQGTYASGISVLLEENTYDHNGWLIRERGNRKDRGGATIFNHNTYFCDCHHVLFRRNLFLRASSIGTKWTANSGRGSAHHLVLDDNLYVEGEIGISMGGNKTGPLRFKDVRVTNNVFLHVGRGRPTLRNLGWYVGATDWDGGLVANNLLALQTSDEVRNVFGLK